MGEGHCTVTVASLYEDGPLEPSVDSALDAAEIEGMQRALPAQPAPLALGSTSKQIGYCLSASGMISVIKAMLELEHQSIAPVAADAEPSELVRNSGSQFTLPGHILDWGTQISVRFWSSDKK